MTDTLPAIPEILKGSHTDTTTPEARRELVGRLRLRGYTLRQISEMTNVSLATVGNDLKKMRDQWKRDASLSYEQYVQQEIANLADIEQQLSDAIATGKTELIAQRTRLAERRARLLGLDSPVKHEVSVVSLDALDHEIARLEANVGPITEIEDEEIHEAEIVED